MTVNDVKVHNRAQPHTERLSQNDSYNNILKPGTTYIEHPVDLDHTSLFTYIL
jgi:hypothetical protein